MTIDNVTVHATGFDKDELKNYVAYVKERQPDVVSITVELLEDDSVNLKWVAEHTKFERIRRITG